MQIKTLLEDWGRWARCRIGTEYPSVAIGMAACVTFEHDGYRTVDWNDDVALGVDGAVAALAQWPEEGEQLRDLLFAHYVGGATLRHISHETGIGRNILARRLLGAEMWVAGCLAQT